MLTELLTFLCCFCVGVSFWCIREMRAMAAFLTELIETYGEVSRTDQCMFNHTHHPGSRCQEKATHKAFILHQGGAMVAHRVCQAHAQVLMSYPGQQGVAYAEELETNEEEKEAKNEKGHDAQR